MYCKNSSVIGIIGGDKRQEYLSGILMERGFSVAVYALPERSGNTFCHTCSHGNHKPYHAGSLEELMGACQILACPVPFSRNGKTISSSMEREDLELKQFTHHLSPGHMLFGGCIPASVIKQCRVKSIPCFDFMEDDSVALKNAVATAEGALMEACRLSPRNFHQNKSVVIGYGKCGSVLADRLRGMKSDVTICARSAEARTRAAVLGFHAIPMKELHRELANASFVFNTVPAIVIDEEHLKAIPSYAVIIDIASAPGGVDFGAASSLGITSSLFLSIPGKVAPYSSAEILADSLIQRFM